MSLARLLAFSLLDRLGVGHSRPKGRPIDWSAIRLGAGGGGDLNTASFAGHVVLLVNTASRCGFTRQYAALEALWRRHRDRGLIVLGVPSNDFGGQEPGSDTEIARFCTTTFDVTFPIAAKQTVSGAAAHPLYRLAAAETGALGTPSWNFHKIVIGRDGRIVDWFSPLAGTGPKFERAIEGALAAPA